VTFHRHYWWYSPPEEEDALGSQREWPSKECVLLLDAELPKDREVVLRKAFGHGSHVWILRLAGRGEEPTRDIRSLVALLAQLFARLPRRSLVLHAKECWSEATYDAKPTKCVADLWRLVRADPNRALVSPQVFQAALGK
jgi:hypothetical protein